MTSKFIGSFLMKFLVGFYFLIRNPMYKSYVRHLFFLLTFVFTPLVFAAEIHKAVKNVDLSKVEQLIASGVNVNKRDVFGNTPLHYIIKYNSGLLKIAETLLENGADVNKRDIFGYTPLYYVTEKRMGRFGMDEKYKLGLFKKAEMFIKKGADVDIEGFTKSSPLSLALVTLDLDLMKLFIESGTKQVNLQSTITDVYSHRLALLHYAVAHGWVKAAKVLLENGADVEVRADVDRWNIRGVLMNRADVEIQVSANNINSSGWTPIVYALFEDKPKMVQLLLDHKASLDVKLKGGRTPRSFAKGKSLKYLKTRECKDLF